MSEYQILAVLAAFAFLYSLVATRLERTPINGALVYVAFGLLCGSTGLRLVDLQIDGEGIKLLAELTLAIVLFTDSAGANLAVLRRVRRLPVRLLLVGLPLTIALGFGVGYLIFDGLGVLEIALLATMLAPTDAALGKAVVTNEAVPESAREGLNVESGLNDGICVPVLLVFLALAGGSAGSEGTFDLVIAPFLEELGIGVLVGGVLAVVGGQLLKVCARRGWVAGNWAQVPVISLAMLCFGSAQWLGGSGFIASFVGGLIFGGLMSRHEEQKETVLRGAEVTGDTMSLLTWFTFGAVAVGTLFVSTTWQIVAYAVLSLTVVRMLPVFLCVAGSGARSDTKLFLGWFGPRGLASIVFVVMVAAENLPGADILVATVTWTVVLSVVGHGVSSNPLARVYGERVRNRDGVT